MTATGPPGPAIVIFTDLDGTFLDHHSYSFEPALPAFRRCADAGVPVVFCSSKTRAEIEPLRARLSAGDPFIVENGGAVFIPPGYFPFDHDLVIQLGVRYRALTATLDRLSGELGLRVQSFHRMTTEQIARETGLGLSDAGLAAEREYDEPFFFVDADGAAIDSFLSAVETEGLHWTRGGRFYHLVGHTGKETAVGALAALHRRWNPDLVTVGLGDSANDVSLLRAVDYPILLPGPTGEFEPEVLQSVPTARRSPFPGPRGWDASVQDFLDSFSTGNYCAKLPPGG